MTLKEFSAMLTKVTVEAALNAELDNHLGYDRHEKANVGNSRNGCSSKILQTEDSQFELNTPRDRGGQLSTRHKESDLYDECYRVTEQRYS